MVGRRNEIEELLKSYKSSESEFVAVYGRRRVGKTYLIRSVFLEKFVFQHSGLAEVIFLLHFPLPFILPLLHLTLSQR